MTTAPCRLEEKLSGRQTYAAGGKWPAFVISQFFSYANGDWRSYMLLPLARRFKQSVRPAFDL